jgi:hypothetical protein
MGGLRAAITGSIIIGVDPRRSAMCHDWWMWRRLEEREESRELWDEFERTVPLSDPALRDKETEVTLEQRESEPVAAER